MMWMTFFGTERFHEALPDLDNAHDPAHAEENAFAAGDAVDDETHHGNAHAGEDDDHDDEHHALPHDFKPHESPWVMTVPLVILAVLSTVGGLVGVPYALSGGTIPNYFEETLEPVIAHVGPKAHGIQTASEPGVTDVGHAAPAESHAGVPVNSHAETAGGHDEHSPKEISKERMLAGLSVILALVGIGIGFALFSKTPLRRMPRILAEKWRIDEFYNGYIVDPITNISRDGLWKGFDVGFIDGIVNGIGHFVAEAGNLARQMQVGFVRSYAAFILLGALVVLGYFIYFGLKLVG
jgi:NADH-quinone oxidoreductase subunit L